MQSLAFPPGAGSWKSFYPAPSVFARNCSPCTVGPPARDRPSWWPRPVGRRRRPAAQAAYGEIARVLQDQGLTIVHERLFGSLKVKPAVMASRARPSSRKHFPEMAHYLHPRPSPLGRGLGRGHHPGSSGLDPADKVWTIRDQGKAVGRGWRRGDATFSSCKISRDWPRTARANTRPLQAKRMIQHAAAVSREPGSLLSGRGADLVLPLRHPGLVPRVQPGPHRHLWALRHLARAMAMAAWRLPASTGIGGEVSTGAAGALDLLAVVGPPDSRPLVRQLSNPAQPEAFTYGSAFSRGASSSSPTSP